MDVPILLDIAVLIILLFFTIRGIQHGFVRALCSFLAVFVAFFGALVISKQLTPMASEFLAPQILPSIVKHLEKDSVPEPTSDLSTQETTIILKKIGLPETWSRMIQQANSAADQKQIATTSPSQLFASYILNIIVSAAIFILSFLLLLLTWLFFSRSLDLLAKLPVLNFCNRILGALFGLCKGVIFLLVLRWLLCDLMGQIPPELLGRTQSYQILSYLFANLRFPNFLIDFYQITWR
ncbi:MAG: hypothetical protein K0S60_362 [Evtepia sp.]|jgi:uncharacterized membrane protein required for colicin V production|nr:hypothetical protein [Evtepia sp.]